jgi:hypothetical protein
VGGGCAALNISERLQARIAWQRPFRPSATSHPTALPGKPDARALLSESQAYHTPCRAKNQQKIKRDPRKRKIGIQKKNEIQKEKQKNKNSS